MPWSRGPDASWNVLEPTLQLWFARVPLCPHVKDWSLFLKGRPKPPGQSYFMPRSVSQGRVGRAGPGGAASSLLAQGHQENVQCPPPPRGTPRRNPHNV